MRRKIIMMGLLIGIILFSFSTQAAEPIRVAAIFSLTGIAANHNAPLMPMVELGIEEVNRQGGVLGRPVELIVLDNQSTPIGSTLAAEEAVRLNVTAVIGAHWSSHSLAIGPILQKAGIPMISPGSTNPRVTQIGDYIFRACFVDSFQGKAMARFARERLNAANAVVLKNIDEAYSIKLAEFFTAGFAADGGRILWEGEYRGKAVDFSDILIRIKQLKPDVVYVPGYTRDSGLLIRQANGMGINTIYLGGDAWDDIWSVAGEAAAGSFHSTPWHPRVPFRQSEHLLKIYQAKYGAKVQNLSAPLAYDATMLLINAIRRAGSLDRRLIRDAIAGTVRFAGATGYISFDDNGDPLDKGVIILKLENGATRFITTVNP